MSTDASRLEQLSIDTIRTLAMDAVQKANSGHPGTAMALAPVAYLLYRERLRHDPDDPAWHDRDRFVLSAGHACILQYAALHLTGYDLTIDDLRQFRQWGSTHAGPPRARPVTTPGVETTTGPLGQGIGNAVGMALAERMLAARYNRPGHEIVDHRTCAICSDGDLHGGRLGRGVLDRRASRARQARPLIYDDNHITIEGDTALAFTEDVGARATRPTAGTCSASTTPGRSTTCASRARRGRRASDAAVADRAAHAHRPGAPNAQDTRRGARRAARRGRGARHQARLRLARDEHFFVPDDVYEHWTAARARREAQRRLG